MLIVDAQVHIWGNNIPANPGHRQIPLSRAARRCTTAAAESCTTGTMRKD
jgi:hypothetical protein